MPLEIEPLYCRIFRLLVDWMVLVFNACLMLIFVFETYCIVVQSYQIRYVPLILVLDNLCIFDNVHAFIRSKSKV